MAGGGLRVLKRIEGSLHEGEVEGVTAMMTMMM